MEVTYIATRAKDNTKYRHFFLLAGPHNLHPDYKPTRDAGDKVSFTGKGLSAFSNEDLAPIQDLTEIGESKIVVVAPNLLEDACSTNPFPQNLASYFDRKKISGFIAQKVSITPKEAKSYEKIIAEGCLIIKPIILNHFKKELLEKLQVTTQLAWKAPKNFTKEHVFLWAQEGDLTQTKNKILDLGVPKDQVRIKLDKKTQKNTLTVEPMGVGLLALVVGLVPKASLKKSLQEEVVSVGAAATLSLLP